MAQGFGAAPIVRDLPAVHQEERDGIEGHPTTARGPAQQLREHRADAIQVDQPQRDVEE